MDGRRRVWMGEVMVMSRGGERVGHAPVEL